jgi:hypothetical protein
MDIAHSGNKKQRVAIGDEFEDRTLGGRWRVIGWSGQHIYSPSGIGGTQCVYCLPLKDMPAHFEKYVRPDGTVEWCGDSVAGCIADGARPPQPPSQASGGGG